MASPAEGGQVVRVAVCLISVQVVNGEDAVIGGVVVAVASFTIPALSVFDVAGNQRPSFGVPPGGG